jgi:FKBP-type peptidyl-prolyl cis-trans isomerase
MTIPTGPDDDFEVAIPGLVDPGASEAFTQTESGLRYRILREGKGKLPTAKDKVTVHYKGWLDNDTIFDSSYRRDETISFGLNQVIKGWTAGMQLIGTGGMIELEIPYQLGYGERGTPGGPIPPRANLHFLVELFEIS